MPAKVCYPTQPRQQSTKCLTCELCSAAVVQREQVSPLPGRVSALRRRHIHIILPCSLQSVRNNAAKESVRSASTLCTSCEGNDSKGIQSPRSAARQAACNGIASPPGSGSATGCRHALQPAGPATRGTQERRPAGRMVPRSQAPGSTGLVPVHAAGRPRQTSSWLPTAWWASAAGGAACAGMGNRGVGHGGPTVAVQRQWAVAAVTSKLRCGSAGHVSSSLARYHPAQAAEAGRKRESLPPPLAAEMCPLRALTPDYVAST